MFRSSNPSFSLGINVVIGMKKVRLQHTKFLLRSRFDGVSAEQWVQLKRAVDKSGKPFRVLRKVDIGDLDITTKKSTM